MRPLRLLALAVTLSVTSAAPASADALADINGQRAVFGLPALTEAADPLAADVARRWLGDRDPAQTYDPAEAYAAAGGRAASFEWVEPGAAVKLYDSTLFDPRARTLQTLAVPNAVEGERVALIVTVDTAVPWTDPILLGPAVVDLNQAAQAPRVMVPPAADGTVTVQRATRRGWMDAGHYGRKGSAEDLLEPGVAGAALVTLAPDSIGEESYAYGSTYRVLAGGGRTTFKTAGAPADRVARSFTYAKSMSPKLRRIFKANVRRGNAQARATLARIDGWVTVEAHNGGNSVVTIDPRYDGSFDVSLSFNRQHLLSAKTSRFITWHELGHVLDYHALEGGGEAAFSRLFARHRHWRKCFPQVFGPFRGCVQPDEVFADQFAYFALRLRARRPADGGGYGDPPLASRAAFGRTLADAFAQRPGRYGWTPASAS